MNAKNIMIQRDDVISSPPSLTLSAARLRMARNNIGGMPVVDSKDKVQGFITMRDITLAPAPSEFKVFEIMSEDVICMDTNSTVRELAIKMSETGIQRIPITNKKGKLMGLVTQSSIIRFVSDFL